MTRRAKVAAGAVLAGAVALPLLLATGTAVSVPDGWAPGVAVDVPGLEPITAVTARRLPGCVTEDYTASPCYWNAARRGNRIGMSFWVGSDGCRHYFAAADEAQFGDRTSPCGAS